MSQRRSMRDTGTKHPLWPVWAICGLLTLGILIMFWRILPDKTPKNSDIAVLNIPETAEVRFRTADLPAGELRLFRISRTGITLVVKRLQDRHVHVALSSCTVCSREGHKSYARKNELFCGVCNQPMRFENDKVAAKTSSGQCPLPEIPASENDGAVVIAMRDILTVADRALMK